MKRVLMLATAVVALCSAGAPARQKPDFEANVNPEPPPVRATLKPPEVTPVLIPSPPLPGEPPQPVLGPAGPLDPVLRFVPPAPQWSEPRAAGGEERAPSAPPLLGAWRKQSEEFDTTITLQEGHGLRLVLIDKKDKRLAVLSGDYHVTPDGLLFGVARALGHNLPFCCRVSAPGPDRMTVKDFQGHGFGADAAKRFRGQYRRVP
jgi:hypothetical protein